MSLEKSLETKEFRMRLFLVSNKERRRKINHNNSIFLKERNSKLVKDQEKILVNIDWSHDVRKYKFKSSGIFFGFTKNENLGLKRYWLYWKLTLRRFYRYKDTMVRYLTV